MNINICAADIALHNHGLVSRRLLRKAGVSPASIDRWLQASSIEVVVPGLYRLFTTDSGLQRIAAATLAIRSGTADLETAAFLHGFDLGHRGLPQVVVLHGGTNRSGLAEVRQTRDLGPLDIAVVSSIRCLTLARTVCELLPRLSKPAAERFVTRAIASGRVTESEIVACDLALARRGRPGVKQRRERLDPLLVGSDVDLTVLEREFLVAYRQSYLPPLEVQFRPPWYDGKRGVVDFARPEVKVIIEVDGRAWHTSIDARQEDARRDRQAVRHGWTVHRFGWDEVVHRWPEVEGHLRVVLGDQRPSTA